MKAFVLCSTLLLASAAAATPDEGTTPEMRACRDFNNYFYNYDNILNATQKDTCTVTCTFVQMITYNTFSDDVSEVAGVSTQPIAGQQSNSDQGLSTNAVNVGYNALQTCDNNKVCVRGVCTDLLTNLTPECQENVGKESVAVKGPNPCLIKCMKLENRGDDQSSSVLVTSNLPMPNRSPCGEGMMCRGRDCLSSSLFTDVC